MLENSSGDVPRARRQRGAAVQHKGVSHLRFAVRWFCPPPGSWPRRPMAGDRVLMTARDRWRGSSAAGVLAIAIGLFVRSEEHTSELQSLMRISYAVFCLKKQTKNNVI